MMGEFPSVIRVDLRPSDDSSLTWSGREREEGEWRSRKEGEDGKRERKRRGGGEEEREAVRRIKKEAE